MCIGSSVWDTHQISYLFVYWLHENAFDPFCNCRVTFSHFQSWQKHMSPWIQANLQEWCNSWTRRWVLLHHFVMVAQLVNHTRAATAPVAGDHSQPQPLPVNATAWGGTTPDLRHSSFASMPPDPKRRGTGWPHWSTFKTGSNPLNECPDSMLRRSAHNSSSIRVCTRILNCWSVWNPGVSPACHRHQDDWLWSYW